MPRFSIGIYHNGESAPFCSTSKLTQNESFMGQNFVSTTIDSPTALGFKVGDYLTYRGRKFVLAVTPSMQKNARVNSVGNAIKYDNVKFISVASDELTRCEFRDVVNSTKDHYNFAARTFSFHCLTLKDYAERLKANLDRMYSGYTIKILLDNGSTYTIGSSTPYNGNAVGEKNKVIQISNETCWDSLQHVKTDFKVNLYFDGDRTIILGANGHLISQHHFAYGAGEGLFKISRTTDESQAIITRLRAYGSEKNMPTRFYANLKYLYLLPKEMITEAQTSKTKIDLVNGTTDFENDGYLTIGFDGKMLANSNLSENNKFKSTANGADKYLIKVRINNVVGWMNIQYNGENYNSYANIGWNNASEYGNNTETFAKALIEEFCKMQWTYFIIEDGATSTWKYKVTDPTCTIPNNMNVKCLMLAGFGFNGNSLRDEVKAVYDRPNTEANKKLIARLGYATFADFSKDFTLSDDPSDPYIDAVPQKKAYGVREGTIVFDGSSEDYDEIYPSIEYMGGIDDCPAQKAKVDGSDTYEGNNLRNDGGVVDDLAEAGKEIPQFYLYIKDPSFDPYEYRKSGSNSFKINMIDGMCGGRSFDVKQAKKCRFEDGSVGYRLVCDRVEDNSLDLYFPYSQIQNGVEVGYVIKAGDKYTFSDIEMPSEYVLRTALYELFPAAVDALKKNRDVRFKYELSVDANEMYRQHVLSLTDDKVESIHDTIHAGDLILFGDKDLGVNYDENEPNPITGSVIINFIEIKENAERLPQYTIQLVDEKTIGTIERIQRQIESIINGTTSTASSGYSATDIQGLIRTYGANYFLSKSNRDTAKGDLTFDGVTTFNKDVNVNADVNFGNSLFKGSSGAGIWKDAQGNWHFQTDFLDVNYSLTAKSIEIQEEKHIGGCQIITGAGCTIDHVDETPKVVSYKGGQYTAYRCYFLAVDPETGKEINNDWMAGDQARCQSFNLKSGIHFYWRLVLNTSIEPEEIDGKKYHYIDLFAGSASGSLSDDVLNTLRMMGSGVPEEKDDVILLGSQSGVAGRQNAIIVAGAGSGSPYIREYAGIKTFSLNDYCEINIEPNNSFLKVKSLTIITSDGTPKDVEEELNNIAGDIQDLLNADGSLDEKIEQLLKNLQLSQKEIDDLKDTQQDVQNQLDQTYEFWHVDWEAQFDKDGNLVMPAWNSVEPIVSWIADNVDLSEHIGDFIITANGVCFQFQDTADGGYELIVRSDKFLIAALGVANNAKMVLEEIANDGIITPQEKTILLSIWEAEKSAANNILSEYEDGYKGKTEYTNMLSHYNALAAAMNTILSNDTWNSNITLSDVVKSPYVSFDDMWGKYYDSKETLLALVSSDIDEKAEEAQAAADAANDTLDDIANDNIITLQEHSELSDIWDTMTSQYNIAISDAANYSSVQAVATAKTNLISSYNTLKTLVEAVLAMTTDYTITQSFNSSWDDFFAKLKALRDAITAAAKAATDAAQTDATNALTKLSDITSDNVIDPSEKITLKRMWNNIVAEYPTISTKASTYLGTTDAAYTGYVEAYTALSAVMASVLESESTNTSLKDGNGNDVEFSYVYGGKTKKVKFSDAWDGYYTKCAAVQKAVDDKIKNAADDAADAANDAQDAADAANDTLDDIASDSVITLQEHSQLSDVWDNMVSQYNMAIADAAKYSDVTAVDTAKTNLTSAYNTLKALVEAVLASTGNYTITEAYNTAWSNFFEKLKALRDAITAAAKAVADNAVDIANQALSAIGTMASDGVINTTEKATLKIVWFGIKQIYPSLLASGNIHVGTTSVAYKNYEKAYIALTATMNAVLADMAAPYNLKTGTGADVTFSYSYGGTNHSVTFMDAWDGYYAAEAALQYAIDSAIQADADASLETLENMASDSVITKQEKIQILAELAEIVSANDPIVSEASNLQSKLASILETLKTTQERAPYEVAKKQLEDQKEEYDEAYDIVRAMYGYLTEDVTSDTNLTSEGNPLRYKYSTDTFSYSSDSDDGLTYGECVTKYYTEYPQLRSIITITQQIITQYINNSVDSVSGTIANMANDGLITPQEKTILKIIWQSVQREYGEAEKKNLEAGQADSYLTSWNDLFNYHDALSEIMTAILMSMATTSNLSTITGSYGDTNIGFTAAWTGYNAKYNQFIEEYEDWKQNLINNAQDTANEANENSQQAIDTANEASSQLSEMASDNIITAQEKIAIKERLIELQKEREGIVAEATTANVSSTAYQSAYNGLVCFLQHFVNESGDTYITTDDGTLYATYQYAFVDTPRIYSITRTKGGMQVMAGIYYTGNNGAVTGYYNALANLRKSITNGVYTAIQQANESGYDQQVNDYVLGLMSGNLSNLINQGIENHAGYSQMSAYYSTMSNFSFTTDDEGNYYINGAGIVTSANYAKLFAAAYNADGSILKQALVATFVTLDENGYVSNAKIKADRIELEGSITANGNVSIGTDGKITAKEGSFYNGYFNKGTFVEGDFTGKITATTGTIGGFEIGSGRIGVANTTSSSSYNGMSLYNEFICFNGHNKQSIIGVTDFLDITILGKFTNTDNSYGKNYGLVVNVKNGINNIALTGSGNTSMDGFVQGWRMNKVTLSSANTYYVIGIENGTRYYVTGTASGCGITLPTLQSVCDSLDLPTTGTGDNRKPTCDFMVKLEFVTGNVSHEYKITGRNRIVTQKVGTTTTYPQDNAEYPQLLNNDFDNIDTIPLQKGDCHQIMLVYDYSANKYYAFRLNYRD